MQTALIIVLVLACAGGLAMMVVRRKTVQLLDRRLTEICGAPKDLGEQEDDAPAVVRASVFSLIAQFLKKSGLEATDDTARNVVLIAGASAIPLHFLLGWKIALLLIALIGIGFLFGSRWPSQRRARRFVESLPGFLERVRQLVLVGNTFQQAFSKAAASAEPIVAENVGSIVRRVQHGATLVDSIDTFARQMDVSEVQMLAAYVRANTRYGGKLSQSLLILIEQMNNRMRLEREIRAATAETRASAIALCLITVAVIVIVSVLNKSYVEFFMEDRTGRMVLIGIIGWPVIGLAVMRKIMKVGL